MQIQKNKSIDDNIILPILDTNQIAMYGLWHCTKNEVFH